MLKNKREWHQAASPLSFHGLYHSFFSIFSDILHMVERSARLYSQHCDHLCISVVSIGHCEKKVLGPKVIVALICEHLHKSLGNNMLGTSRPLSKITASTLGVMTSSASDNCDSHPPTMDQALDQRTELPLLTCLYHQWSLLSRPFYSVGLMVYVYL